MAFEDPCVGLVEEIEAGKLESPRTEQILQQALDPMLRAGTDTIVLGCTHYPFVIPLIEKLAGPQVAIIDPAPAVARQTHNVLKRANRLANRTRPGTILCYSSYEPLLLTSMIRNLMGKQLSVIGAAWHENGRLALE
jgi:glutamate racemase